MEKAINDYLKEVAEAFGWSSRTWPHDLEADPVWWNEDGFISSLDEFFDPLE